MSAEGETLRERETRERWQRIADRLQHYTRHISPGSWFPWREGRWVAIALAAVLACDIAAAAFPPAACLLFVVTLLVALDILLVNTAIAFLAPAPAVVGGAVHPLRSVLFTIVGYFNLALAFVPLWIRLDLRNDGSTWGRLTGAIYQSVRTITTAGPDVEPSRLDPWGQLLTIAELMIGIYFLVIILAIYASRATR